MRLVLGKVFLLKDISQYSTQRIDIANITVNEYITTDSLLPNKLGKVTALNLPPQDGNLPAYKKNNILIGNIRPYLKKIWFADNNGGCSSDVLTIEINDNIDAKFVYYALFRDDFFIHMMKGSKGTKMPRGDKSQIMDFTIPKFPLITQQKIANILSTLDAKIELNNRINTELEAMAKTLYDYWFVQFDFPNAKGEPYKSSGGKMVYNEELKREIPEGWMNGNILDYSTVKSGFAFKSTCWMKKGIPVLKITNIQENGTISFDNCSFVEEEKVEKARNFIAKGGDVLIAMTGATIGKLAIVPDYHKTILINQRVGLFNLGDRPYEKLPFLINSLKQKYIRENIYSIASGCAQPNISSENINNLELIRPKKDIVKKFNDSVKFSYKTIILNQKQTQTLKAQRDFLLPMLMNGQVSVK